MALALEPQGLLVRPRVRQVPELRPYLDLHHANGRNRAWQEVGNLQVSWYPQALTELSSLLDQIGEEGSVVLEPDSAGTAAIVAMLEGAAIVHAAGQSALRTVATMAQLEAELSPPA